ncbi:RNA-dependent RNA polymerase 1 [Choanephora cucurbitarum]|uniref:RNA-dependent RNA polymerase n=1 Tax=Choanephora cucurbitarum TaxID=101091 RepID=A0A1C7NL68_9FUNG|nr:RNA-dependent RNA polymerase 1 [Choanephora cucurbitarum]
MVYIDTRLVHVRPYSISSYLDEVVHLIPATKLSFGGLESPSVYIEEWSTDQYVTFCFNAIENYIDIFFNHFVGYYRCRIAYTPQMYDNVVLQRHDNITSITISGDYPAHFWRSKRPMERLENLYFLEDWERVTEIPLDEFSFDMIRNKATANPESTKGPISPGGQYPGHMMKLNMWTVYRLEFMIPLKSYSRFLSPQNITHEALENELALAHTTVPRLRSVPTIIQVRQPIHAINIESYFANMSFELQYLMEHAFNLKIFREYNIDSDFLEKISLLPEKVVCVFLTLLVAPQQRIYFPDAALNEAFRVSKDNINFQQPIPEDYTTVRRVIVTPTSIYPLQPAIEPMNHLQYHFKQYAHCFLYVQFTDEDLTPVVPTQSAEDDEETKELQNDRIYERIYNILKRGLRIAGRNYEYLGASVNQLRSHGCWFISPTADFTRAKVLNWIGDFKEIETVSKFSTCVGQLLQPRLCNILLDSSEIEEIEDYYNNGFDFAPECGKMSPEIARAISNQLDMNYSPSVVKFRLAGARGILVISNYLRKRKIQLRSSQIHFNSPDLSLDIIKVSKPNRVYLNRRIILLLSSLGVQDYVFRQLANEELAYWEKYKTGPENVYHDILDEHFSSHRMDDFQRILDAKFLESHDPFISNLAISFQNRLLRGLKENCSLFIHKGARVFAVMDETNTLDPGEVFLQLSDPSGKTLKRKIVEGACIVYRESSCFPGDVRQMTAVYRPQLRHYCNVLVYSSIEQRDLLSICSNDDPDDDNVSVIWDTRLLPRRTNLHARNYETSYTPRSLKRITFRETAKFFTTYVSQDTSYLLKKAYTIMADKHADGILSGNCIYLSQQMSRAIDFAKTGMYATINREFIRCPYPDYMEGSGFRTYKSQKIVGMLHREIKQYQEKPLLSNHCYYDRRMYVPTMYKYILDARKLKAKYDHSLRLLLAQYSVKTEVEFVSGHILSWPKYLGINQRQEFLERICNAYSKFKAYWKHVFNSPFLSAAHSGDTSFDLNDEIEARAAAWYYVTYHPSEFKSERVYKATVLRFVSFPWVVDEYISRIAIKNNSRSPMPEQIQPVPQELIFNPSILLQDNVIYSESEDDDDDEDDEDSETENNIPKEETEASNQIPLNVNDTHVDQEKETTEDYSNEQEDESLEVTVKLNDLLNLN